jgi:Cys-tRNA synthase (O-phospho-L-seryl-tRNA:Cys-tRNA synthase)
MDVPGKLHAEAAKLVPHDGRPTCECCGQGKLDLIDERPHPILGIAGITCQTLKCDFLECGKLTSL